MRFIILRMIAAGSLSAFNAANPAAIGIARPAGPAAQPARATASPTPQPAPPAIDPRVIDPSAHDKPGAPPGGRILPRGSLLNLSV